MIPGYSFEHDRGAVRELIDAMVLDDFLRRCGFEGLHSIYLARGFSSVKIDRQVEALFSWDLSLVLIAWKMAITQEGEEGAIRLSTLSKIVEFLKIDRKHALAEYQCLDDSNIVQYYRSKLCDYKKSMELPTEWNQVTILIYLLAFTHTHLLLRQIDRANFEDEEILISKRMAQCSLRNYFGCDC
jgi:hypothetical protein